MAIRIYNVNHGKIVTQFLDMCTSTCATAEAIYGVMDEILSKLLESTNPWTMCTSVGVDNTSVNIGTRNSLKTRIVQRNSAIYFNGCPCHIVHKLLRKVVLLLPSAVALMQKSLLLICTIGLISQQNEKTNYNPAMSFATKSIEVYL